MPLLDRSEKVSAHASVHFNNGPTTAPGHLISPLILERLLVFNGFNERGVLTI